MAGHPHHDAAPATLAVALLTVSDTRTPENDGSGALLRSLLEAEGHRAFAYRILPDDPDAVRQAVSTWLGTDGCDGVVTSGGTGISSRDRTFEAVEGLIERRLDGFGELFRMLSYAEIGSAAMLSRAALQGARFQQVLRPVSRSCQRRQVQPASLKDSDPLTPVYHRLSVR